MGDQHSELSSPIADVVETKDVMAKELKESADAVTNDGGPKVAHMHLHAMFGEEKSNTTFFFAPTFGGKTP